jgi:hypothetical protein
MINGMMQRRSGATTLSVLNPAWLIDRLLDELEKMSIAILPASACRLPQGEMQIETRAIASFPKSVPILL